jgi:RNA polymerase sigma factor (sigma-70 family)
MENLRPLLTTYAYNITGCIDEAKDIVQDVYMKFLDLETETLNNQEAYIKRMVINRAINFKRKHSRFIRDYPGEWLPEPISSETADGNIIQKELLSYSVMVMLEKLNPKQRAVFILKEAFDYEHSEIAETIGISEENSRQLLTRAKKQVKAESISTTSTPDHRIVNKYLEVLQRADTTRLIELLNEDITIVSDGGGKATASINPICGFKNAAAFLSGIYRKFYLQTTSEMTWVNHQPALFYFEDGSLRTCFVFDIQNDQIQNIYVIRNPDKLAFLKR